MASHINFEAKSDRELLLLVAQQTNALTEQRIPEMEDRLTAIEKECKKRVETCPGLAGQTGSASKKTLATGAGIGSGGLAVLYLIAKIILANYGVEI